MVAACLVGCVFRVLAWGCVWLCGMSVDAIDVAGIMVRVVDVC